MAAFIVIHLILSLSAFHVAVSRLVDEDNSQYWINKARWSLKKRLRLHPEERNRVAKNAIIFLGDGMGIATVTAGRIYAGQKDKINGGHRQETESYMTAIDHMPVSGFSKTYSVDHQTTDSAASATAYLCGVKARSGTLGVNGHCIRGDCKTCSEDTYVWSVIHRAHQIGKWTGVITNTRITHATPAGAYAHCSDRQWEAFDGVNFNCSHFNEGCRDIAHQLIENASYINVIFGGGRAMFLPTSKGGKRIDGRNLIDKWKSIQNSHHRHDRSKYKYIETLQELNSLPESPTKNVLGLFSDSHVPFRGGTDAQNTPTLSDMTTKAIKILSHSPKGFVLLVEGGMIDVAHHGAQPGLALEEFVNFDKAIGQARTLISEANTHIVVTADHSHVFSIGGYAWRNSDILGYAVGDKLQASDVDGMPMTIALYGNGPGYIETKVRNDAGFWDKFGNNLERRNLSLRYAGAVPLKSETHGGEDVPIYSSGPGSGLFTGTMEQNTIAHVVAYATLLPPYNKRPVQDEDDDDDDRIKL